MKDNLIIVGGSGLVGKALFNLKSIQNNFNIFILDKEYPNKKMLINKKQIKFFKCNINLNNFYNGFIEKLPKKSFIINLAARQYADHPPRVKRLDWFLETNYYGSKNVLELALKLNSIGFIQFSSDMVYGIPSSNKIIESHKLNPIGEYGKSKMKIENYINKNRIKFKFPISIMRPRMIIGKGRLGVLKKLFLLIKNNIPVPLIGSGQNYYQMISDKDCARAIYFCLKQNCPSETFNLGSYVKANVEELLTNLVFTCGSRSILLKTYPKLVKIIIKFLRIFFIEILYKEQYELADKNFILDISKSNKILKWHPKDDDAKMLKIAYGDWIKQRL